MFIDVFFSHIEGTRYFLKSDFQLIEPLIIGNIYFNELHLFRYLTAHEPAHHVHQIELPLRRNAEKILLEFLQ